ncbi:MAG: TonB family protein [Alphaproteobacteria bacterium]|nr:TonB family protein [Alphaproteobacteria bacterium]
MVAFTGEAAEPMARGQRGVPRPWALVAAAALHLLPLLVWLWHWPAAPAARPTTFAVTLVQLPPKPKAAPPPPTTAQPRESGRNQTTEAKKTARAELALPRTRAEPSQEARHAAVSTPKPEAEGLRVLELRLPPRGGTADRNRAGDPYLNDLMQRIERNRIYPPPSAFYGASERTVVYSVGVDPAGTVSTITLLTSSGQSLIDEAARQMIAASAPFPHLPSDLPQIRTSIVIVIPIYPRG